MPKTHLGSIHDQPDLSQTLCLGLQPLPGHRLIPLRTRMAGFSRKRLNRLTVLSNRAEPGILQAILLKVTERLS
jgi:hypothetical protein